ncbi:MAG: Mrp/NBP35 family ATP-binding protein [Spirochaetales bacterium]|nr:Mrp/NBP35 family ATP-binding protein [Spirochaetales bacterium]
MAESERIMNALRQVMHPEIKRSVVELGMIKAVEVDEVQAFVTLALPFKEIPIREELVAAVRQAAERACPQHSIEVRLVEMSQPERAAFMAASEGGPGPAQSANRIQRVIAVLSGKGGVGKSSVASLLAVVLRRQGRRVGVLDADITGPSIPKMFGLHALPPPTEAGILPAVTSTGIAVISINLLLQDERRAVIWRGPLISGAIKQFWTDVVWGALDYLVVDLPPGTSDASLTVMQSIPLNGVVLVTSPQDLAGMVVAKAAHMADQMKAPILGLVENMSYLHCPKCNERIEVFGPSQAEHAARSMGVPLLGQLPLDPELARHCDAGQIEAYLAESFLPIAEAVVERLPTAEAEPSR